MTSKYSSIKRMFFIAIFAFFSTTAFSSEDAVKIERVVWNYEPIRVVIPVGEERRMEFPESVNVELKQYLADRSEIKILGEGVIYWRAKAPFERTRIDVITEEGFTYILDIEGIDNPGPTHALKILDKRYPEEEFSKTKVSRAFGVPPGGYDYVEVQRMVSHKVLGQVPKRVAVTLPGVTPVSLSADPIALYRTGQFTARPMTQWKAPEPHSFYVTAVKLINRTQETVTFDPYMILGEFEGATPLHKEAFPKGHDKDTMIVLMVSKMSFMESIK